MRCFFIRRLHLLGDRRVELTDEITLYKGEIYENIGLFNFYSKHLNPQN